MVEIRYQENVSRKVLKQIGLEVATAVSDDFREEGHDSPGTSGVLLVCHQINADYDLQKWSVTVLIRLCFSQTRAAKRKNVLQELKAKLGLLAGEEILVLIEFADIDSN